MPEKYSNVIAASDNTRNDARRQAELAYRNRTKTIALLRREKADERAENAIKEREARRKDPEYDEKKRKAKVAEHLKQNDDGKYTSKKNTFLGRFADNVYHNSGADYYVNRAKELAKEGAGPLTQLANTGVGVIGTTFNSAIGGIDAIGNLVSPKSNLGTSTMGLLTETPVGAVPVTLMNTARQLGGATGETGAEVLATVIPGMRRGRVSMPPRAVVMEPGNTRGIPTVFIEGNGTPRYRWARPNSDQSTWRFLGANVYEPMSRAEIAEAIQNGTMRISYLDGNVGGIWRNIDHNGGVHVLTIPTRTGGRFLPNDRPATIYLPNGLAVTVDPALARQYLEGSIRYPSLLTDSELRTLSRVARGTAEFDGYGIRGPRYRINNGNESTVLHYPEIANMILRRPSLQEFIKGKTTPEEILAAKWEYMRRYSTNPKRAEAVQNILERALNNGESTKDVLSTLPNGWIDFLADENMLNEPRHTRNLVSTYDPNTGLDRGFTPAEVEASVKRDWEDRVRGSMFTFRPNTNTYSYQSHLKALLTLLRKVESGDARLLKPGKEIIDPNNLAWIEAELPDGTTKLYEGSYGGRAAGPMKLSKLNGHYRRAYEKLNELGRRQYGDLWPTLTWEDITPEQLDRQYFDAFDPNNRKHADIRALIYKNGGKPQLYNKQLISKIKNA